jgi:hypothetical protein
MFVLRLRQVARPAWGFVAAISLVSLYTLPVLAADPPAKPPSAGEEKLKAAFKKRVEKAPAPPVKPEAPPAEASPADEAPAKPAEPAAEEAPQEPAAKEPAPPQDPAAAAAADKARRTAARDEAIKKLDPKMIERFRQRSQTAAPLVSPEAKSTKAAPPESPAAKKSPPSKVPPDPSITFSKHIAGILWKNCAGCHRPGEIGPFSLLDYADASKRAEFIAEVTASRRMPPWRAEPNFGKFRDERRLTDREIEMLSQWAQNEAPEGDLSELPKQPEFSDGWQLGKPDLELKMAKPFAVPADGPDIYRCFVIPIPLEKDMMVRAVEFRPGNRSLVHHAIMFLDASGAGRRKDALDEEQGFESFGGPGIQPTGGLGAWAPGAMPRELPEGIVKYVKKGSDLVLQIHYHPNGKPQEDQSVVGVYFAPTDNSVSSEKSVAAKKTSSGKATTEKPTKKIVTGIAVAQPGLEIPAGAARHEITAQSHPIPCEVQVLGITPHMHNLGREMKVTATQPDGEEEIPLIWIKDWDFNWQGQYQFDKPVRLPKGSVIKVLSIYDNSEGNPKNPNNPPQAVKWGEQTSDEMCLCGVQVFTDKPGDLRLIAAMKGNEMGAGLEGGIPGLPIRRQVATKKAGAKDDSAADGKPTFDNARRSAKKDDPFGEDGIAIPDEEQPKRLLSRFDLDKDGKLTRKEVNKMPSGLQPYAVRTLIK